MERLYVVVSEALECWTRQADGWGSFRSVPDSSVQCVAAANDRPERVFCGTFEEGLFRSVDGGRTFDQVGKDVIRGAAVMSLAIDPSDPDVVFAGTEPSALYRSSDGGTTWEKIVGLADVPSASEWYFPPRPETHHVRWIEVAPSDPDRWYVGIEAGALVMTPDGGATWIDRPPGSRRDNHTLATHPDAPERVYAAAGDGYAESGDAGEQWSHPQDGLEHGYVWGLAVDPGDPDTRLVSAARGASAAHRQSSAEAYVYRKRGEQPWERLEGRGLPMGDGILRYVLARGQAPGTFAAASNSGVFLTGDRGASWARVNEAGVERSGARDLVWLAG